MNFGQEMIFKLPAFPGNNQIRLPGISGVGLCLPNEPIVKDQGYFTIVGPGTIRSGCQYNLIAALHESKEPCQIKIAIKGPGLDISKTLDMQPMSLQNLEFDIPKLCQGDYEIIAEAVSGIICKRSCTLNIDDNLPVVLIQTDKATYKPGDLIQFRVLFIDDFTRPAKPNGSITIFIKDGDRNCIKQWKNIDLIKGVYSGRYQLSEHPVLGNWLIDVSLEGSSVKAKEFEVAKYVLPKFNVTIETAKNIVISDKIIHITVRSKYTYGKNVKGKAVVTIKPSSPIQAERTIEVDGKGEVEFKLSDDLTYVPSLFVEVVMEEELTGNKQKANGTIQLHKQTYSIKGIDFPTEFCIGRSLSFKVAVENFNRTPVIDSENSVKLILKHKSLFGRRFPMALGQPSPNIKDDCVELSANLDENGIATFSHCFEENAQDVYHIDCTYKECTTFLGFVHKVIELLKPTELLQIKLLTNPCRLGESIRVKISSSETLSYFVYTIVGRGKILKSELITLPDNTYEHTLEFKPTFGMVPNAVMFVHQIVNNSLRSKELRIPIESEFLNKISITSPSEAKLGEDVELQITTPSDSYIGLLGVDQSVLLLKSGNDLCKEAVFNGLEKFSTSAPKRYDYGERHGRNSGLFTLTNLSLTVPRMQPMAMYGAAFGTQACSLASVGAARRALPLNISENNFTLSKKIKSEPVIQIRKEFPENWFFDDIECTKNGVTSLRKKVPDTITSWVITGFSIHPEHGLAITEQPTTIKTFRPFFITTNLPYSIKRGEEVCIPVLLFNYTNEDLDSEVTLDNGDDEFVFTEPGDSQENRIKLIHVKANNCGSVQFPIRPRRIGHITLKIKAVSPLAGDAIDKKLKVEPEGVTIFKNQDFYLHGEENVLDIEKSLKLDIPEEIVSDSEFIEFSVMGNILSSTITNLDKLVRMPVGCGEQNMINFVPNIMVLWYLESVGELYPAIESKAKQFMEIGYQRELTYKHNDGSFSAFGKSDRSGSTWLTAYVVRSFHQAKPYIDISPNILKDGLNFLASTQASDGSFPEVGRVVDFSHMSKIGLTAFVLLAFLENKEYIDEYRKAIDNGFEYLQKSVESTDDMYGLSVALYALCQRKSEIVKDLLVKLDSKACTNKNHKWWIENANSNISERCLRSSSHNVEITGYILMTMIDMNLPVLPIIKWLISQRNSYGGFTSTQETVVGLWALIKFEEKSSSNNTDINIEVIPAVAHLSVRKLNVDKNNALVLQTVELPKQTRELKFIGKGTGTAILQVSYRYNIVEKELKPSFKLSSTVRAKKSMKYFGLDIVAEFLAIGNETISNMVLMEVNLPSGYTARTEDFAKIRQIEGVKCVETKDENTVIIVYFDRLKVLEPKCIPIEAELIHEVAGQKPVPIVVYDYYDSQKRATDYYQVENSLQDI